MSAGSTVSTNSEQGLRKYKIYIEGYVTCPMLHV
jgi:hypothetical protein